MWGKKREVTLAFQGGGARGCLGAVKALKERQNDIIIRNVAGGGLVGAFIAMGMEAEEMEDFFKGQSEKFSIGDILDWIPRHQRQAQFDKNLQSMKEAAKKTVSENTPWFQFYEE